MLFSSVASRLFAVNNYYVIFYYIKYAFSSVARKIGNRRD